MLYTARVFQEIDTHMTKRRVIEVPGLTHANPIPLATRIGSLLVTGAVTGRDPESGRMPPELSGQCALVFQNIRRIMQAAGGSTEDIIKLNVWLKDIGDKEPLNKEWLAMFPDEGSRPARHTFGDPDMAPDFLILCEIMAILD